MYNFRKVTKNDIKLLFDWANDPDVRVNAKNSKPITWDEHVIWFNNRLSNKFAYTYILSDLQESIGIVRFDKTLEGYVVSYSIDKNYRGKGFGELVLVEGLKNLYLSVDKPNLVAYVKKGNIASEKIFNKLGFILKREEILNSVKFNIYQK
jgi:RimJ/RimL family protein N-acetyltransferase